MQKGTILVLIGLILSGCGVVKRGTIPWDESKPKSSSSTNTNSGENESSPTGDIEPAINKSPDTFVEDSEPLAIQEMQEFLQLAYDDWKGTPYLLGGAGYDGIDCSAFMQVVFEDYFSIDIPRTTRRQLQVGEEIKKAEAKTGDLVFFKTGSTTYHVGVMINRQEFLHASTSSGVKLSNLDHPFWVETYLTTKRIF